MPCRKIILPGVLAIIACLSFFRPAMGQDSSANNLDAIVISASRIPQKQDSLPIPVTVIGKREIRALGSRRLLDVLREQTGFNFTTDEHGTGVQLQGMAPDYTMILIDGQPMIGRVTGKFDLNRITVANIEQIEIIKGASSSLYGSEAMGGVINIITKNAGADTSVALSAKYGGYGVADLSAAGNFVFDQGRAKIYFNGDYYKTDGFAVSPDGSGFKNLPPYHSYTVQGKLQYRLSNASSLLVSGRYGIRSQKNTYDFTGNKPQEDGTIERDANISASWLSTFSPKWKSNLTYYYNRYRTDEQIALVRTGELTDSSFFNQRMQRLEWQHNYRFSDRMLFTGGAGGTLESVNATRYPGERHMGSAFVYGQQQVFFRKKWNITGGFRGDWNELYGGQINPKLAIQYQPGRKIQVRGSAGRGFKSPDFRQLYLSFTNPLVGYTVVGTEEVNAEMAKLHSDGVIATVFPGALSSVRNLKAEHSWSYNAGFSLRPHSSVRLNINGFYNRLNNLILTVPIAEKTNNQQVFSYINVSRAFTSGMEADITWRIARGLELRWGYQLLYAKDLDVVDSIRSGKYRLRDPETGAERPAKTSDYYGLTLRSRHQMNLKLLYCYEPLGTSFSLRGNFLGKSPYAAVSGNGTGFTNKYDKFTPSWFLFSGSAEKSFLKDRIAIQLICDNILGYTHVLIPGQPGRQVFAGIRWNWNAGRENNNRPK